MMMAAMLKVAGRSYMNGVPVDDVAGLIASVTRRPSAGRTRWRVANTWRGRMRSSGRSDGFEIGGQRPRRPLDIEVDTPSEMGGTDNFASPQEYLLAALNACMTARFTALCALEGLEIYRLEIATEGELDLRGSLGVDASVPCGFSGLATTVTVRGPETPEAYGRIFAAVLATSANLANLTQPVRVAADLVVA
jgi:uncharacterized OsmC-like protein